MLGRALESLGDRPGAINAYGRALHDHCVSNPDVNECLRRLESAS
jgi:hypothetical protein